ncbi:hypothetical protein L2E82_16976 [Cichorium intybus]|uniref:Uncharacterized protein n=1 Tax=Cichorium intybus TaxID=13427 RepID=A0ACB9F6Z6_CICIN|nr:hypothetical protein L2E82_16976 [Cichorium intybus]
MEDDFDIPTAGKLDDGDEEDAIGDDMDLPEGTQVEKVGEETEIRRRWIPYTNDLECSDCEYIRLGFCRPTSKIGPSSCGSRTTCWFKFGKNGVDVEGAGIYGSESRDDFDRDDVEQIPSILVFVYRLSYFSNPAVVSIDF